MKKILFLLITTALVSLFWLIAGIKITSFDAETKILEQTTPISGRIDLDYLKENLKPAYE